MQHYSYTLEYYRYRGRDCDNIAFLDQELSSFVAQLANLRLGYRTTCSKLSNGSIPAELEEEEEL